MTWEYIVLVILLVAILLIVGFLKNLLNSVQYEGAYKKVDILTEHEKQNFKILKNVTDKLRLYLFVKVRIADIITPTSNGKRFQTLFNKICSKHVDFVICDSYLKVVCAVELDDKSHNSKSRKERDEFINLIFKDVGINLIRGTNFNAVEFESKMRSLHSNISR